jgi:parallel beta-helix repeat protein
VKRLILLALALTALLTTFGMTQVASANHDDYDFIVDDDFGTAGECPHATHATLAGAVAAASNGDNILVCPGTYAGTTINKRLDIDGAADTISSTGKCFRPVDHPGTDDDDFSVINGGLDITANDVKLKRLTLQAGAEGVMVGAGVSGLRMKRNIVQDNTIGIYLNGSGHEVTENCIRMNNLAGSASGNGIYTDQGLLNSLIDMNRLFAHDATGINLIGPSGGGVLVDQVRILSNHSEDDSDFVSLIDTERTRIMHNSAFGGPTAGDDGALIFVEAGNNQLNIIKNNLLEGDDEGINFDADGGTPNTNVFVHDNIIKNNAGHGINAVNDSLMDSQLWENIVRGNGDRGLGLENGSVNNRVTNNFLRANAGFDCYDENAPGDNFWKKNKGDDQNQPGLCKGTKK